MAIATVTKNLTTGLYEFPGGVPKAVYQFVYDFAVLGGAQASIPLTQLNGALPNNFVIQNAFLDVLTPLTGALAVAAVTTGQAANDLVVATVIAGAPFSAGGVKVTIPLIGTIATWIKTTAQRSPAIVISVANVTAGKFNLFLEGYLSN